VVRANILSHFDNVVFREALSRSLVLQWQNGEIKPSLQVTFRRLKRA